LISEIDRDLKSAAKMPESFSPLGLAPSSHDAAAANAPAQPLRILGVDPELRFAGGETQVLGLTLGLVRAGHQAELACDPRGMLWQRAREAGLRCHPLAIRNALDFGAGLRLRNLLARESYHIVHFHTSRAHSLAPFSRGHAGALIVTRRMDYLPNRLFAPYLYNRAVDAVAAISSRVADALGEAGVARDHLRIIASGVDCAHFDRASAAGRAAARERLGIAGETLLVGSVGMLEERKGHRYLLEAVALLNRGRAETARIKCAIAGDGALRDELAKLAKDSGIAGDLRFLGMIADSRQLLDALDVFVFPSLKEGLGVALLEAMACGLPVVATRAGGVVDIVEDNCSGRLVAPRDPLSIADAIDAFANNGSLRIQFGDAARVRIRENFSMDAMTTKTIDLYRACLLGRANREGAKD
jgi:glycosyltransferase involved in cell wall biosynthesis